MEKLIIYKNREALAEEAALLLLNRLVWFLSLHTRTSLILAGGNTPKGCYRELARLIAERRIAGGEAAFEQVAFQQVAGGEAAFQQLEISRIFWILGDERLVPKQHPRSNERMVRDALLGPLGAAEENILSWRAGEGQPEQRAREYEEALKGIFSPPVERPDILLLGMGDDGHTASLFPDGKALAADGSLFPVSPELPGWTAAVYSSRLDEYRLTLTPRFLKTARRIYFLVSGAGKRKTLKRVLDGDSSLPASWLNLEQTRFLVSRDTVEGERI